MPPKTPNKSNEKVRGWKVLAWKWCEISHPTTLEILMASLLQVKYRLAIWLFLLQHLEMFRLSHPSRLGSSEGSISFGTCLAEAEPSHWL